MHKWLHDPGEEFAAQAEVIEAYLKVEFGGVEAERAHEEDRRWLSYLIRPPRTPSCAVAFSRDFLDAPPEEVRNRLETWRVAERLTGSGEIAEHLVLTVRDSGMVPWPRKGPLPAG